MKQLRAVFFISLAILFASDSVIAVTWTTVDATGASFTRLYGISGNRIVGDYSDASYNVHSFVYDGTNWTDIMGGVKGIDGSNIVGQYSDSRKPYYHSYRYDGAHFYGFDAPGATGGTYASAISGSNIVGRYEIFGWNPVHHSFLYNGTSWSIIDKPGVGGSTYPQGIDGSNIVGYYLGSGIHGFLYDGTTWITLDAPGYDTTAMGISGNNIVGWYWNNSYHGFLYNGATYTTIDIPGARDTYVTDIDGRNLVGYYTDTLDKTHGFVYEIPEPATILFITLAIPFLLKRKRSSLQRREKLT